MNYTQEMNATVFESVTVAPLVDYTEEIENEVPTDDIVELNVGGKRISTLRSTLTAVPNSKLAQVFTRGASEQHREHFFDYNPVQFEYLLDQLRVIKRLPPVPVFELNLTAPHADFRFNFSLMLDDLGLNGEHRCREPS